MSDSTSQLIVSNPWSQETVATLRYIRESEAMEALDRAQRCYDDRDNWLSPARRIEILSRFGELCKDQFDSLVRTAVQEGGKPFKDTQAEITRALNGVQLAITAISNMHGTEIPMGINAASQHRFAHTYFEPRGVVLAISAFNHPFNLIIHQVVTAVAAGCPVLVKPASSTPLSCQNVVALLHEAGLPKDWCQMVMVPGRVAQTLVQDPRISFLSFIGSAAIGWKLRSLLPPGATCALEHGGVAPVIMDESADFAAAITPLVKGGFYHAGQVCVSVQRIYVPKGKEKEFVEPFVAAIGALKTGDPMSPDTDVGPLISAAETARVDEWVKEAIAQGAQCLCGGEPINAWAYAPTVLLNPPEDCKVSTQEVFGPVVAIYTYDDLDEAIVRANQLDVDFQAAVFAKNLDIAFYASRRLKAMGVMVNDHTAFRVDWMPFGGHRRSGLGVGGIGHSIKDMSLERLIVFKSDRL